MHWLSASLTSTTGRPPVPTRDWPKRKILDTTEEIIGQDPYTGRDVVVAFDHLECGHRKKKGAWKARGVAFVVMNQNRHCESCHREGRT